MCVVGATGLVGRTLIDVLIEKKFPLNELVLVASSSSVGSNFNVGDCVYKIKKLENEVFKDMDFVFFCAGGEISKKWVDIALGYEGIVIDNSSYFRMLERCSLIVPEVNFDTISLNDVISNPNCSTIQAVLCLNPLKKFGIKRVIYHTYQSISGSGNKALIDKEGYYPFNIKKTCIPKIDSYTIDGYTLEEMKMINETKKILNISDLNVSSTCVRVPVDFSHGVGIVVEFEKDFLLDDIYKAFNDCEEIILVDCPTSIHSNGNDKVYVGRIRKDIYNPKTLMFYCVADNIRRGAASNAVLIALKIIKNGIA